MIERNVAIGDQKRAGNAITTGEDRGGRGNHHRTRDHATALEHGAVGEGQTVWYWHHI